MIPTRAALAPLFRLQWGHGSEAVEDFGVEPTDRGENALQWGHGPEAVEDVHGLGSWPAYVIVLQWGHGSEAEEDGGHRHQRSRLAQASMGSRLGGRGRRRHRCCGQETLLASMGPRPGGRGRQSNAWPVKLACRRFNGATARRPWKTDRESADLRKYPHASMGPRPGGRGRRLHRHPKSSATKASMGPRPGGRGRRSTLRPGRVGIECFNGATARRPWKTSLAEEPEEAAQLLQWGHGPEAVEDRTRNGPSIRQTSFNGATARRPWKTSHLGGRSNPRLGCFNGVTARRPWKTFYARVAWLVVVTLQWGHGPEAVEDAPAVTSLKKATQASMGPRPGGRGRLTWTISKRPSG